MAQEQTPDFAGILRRARRAAGLSQEELAERSGLSARAISDLERGVNRSPRRDTLEMLADALALSPDERRRWERLRRGLAAHAEQMRAEARAARSDVPEAARAPMHQRTNLTPPPTPLIGRERELAALTDWLQANAGRIVTLIGSGGSGKTRLAIEAGIRLRDDFLDGVYFADLAPITDPGLVMQTIAEAVGVRHLGPQPLALTLRETLQHRSILLIVDNLEQVLDAARDLGGLVANCSNLRVLATSRASLRVRGEREFPVSPLPLPDLAARTDAFIVSRNDAARLFAERARDVQPDFAITQDNAAAIAAICVRLDGLPLAIELAAARVKVLSPNDLLARLDASTGSGTLKVLTGGPRDAPSRHQTMRDTIQWSYELLTPDEQRLFRTLAIFAGGWTMDAAGAVCDRQRDVLEGLAALADHSLIRQIEQHDGSTRFAMLEIIREYGLEQLVQNGDADQVYQRFTAYILHSVEHIDLRGRQPAETTWMAHADIELANVRAALEWAVTHDAESALRVITAFNRYWWRRGGFHEARRWIERALANDQTRTSATRPQALLLLGVHATTQGDFAQGERRCSEALELFRERGDQHGMAQARWGLGRVAHFTGNYALALDHYEASHALGSDLIDTESRCGLLTNLALVSLAGGDHTRATRYFADGLDLARQIGDLAAEALILADSARLPLASGDIRGAREHLVASLTIHQQQMLERRFAVQALEQCAWLAAVQVQPERVARLLGAVNSIRASMGVPIWPHIQADYDRYVPAARARIDAATWDHAWSAGQSMTLEAAIAYALADEAAVAAPVTGGVSDALTLRERDVLRLIVEGKTDREIAAALFISHHTVMRHVSNILGKLGVESRTAAATYAVRHNLH